MSHRSPNRTAIGGQKLSESDEGARTSALVALRPFNGPVGSLTVIESRLGSDPLPSPKFIATEVAGLLGYEGKGSFETSLSRWREAGELRDGDHIETWTGDALAGLKAANLVGARAPAVTLLTERGLWRVLILTGKPAGVRLRDWLDSEVLPEIARTGGYGSARHKAELAERKLAIAESRERRALAEQFLTIAKAAKGAPAAMAALAEAAKVHGVTLPVPQVAAPKSRPIDAVLAVWVELFGDAPTTTAEAWAHPRIRDAADAARIRNTHALGIAMRSGSELYAIERAPGTRHDNTRAWMVLA